MRLGKMYSAVQNKGECAGRRETILRLSGKIFHCRSLEHAHSVWFCKEQLALKKGRGVNLMSMEPGCFVECKDGVRE